MPTEDWKPVPGYEDLYEISNEGRVRSFDRLTDHGKEIPTNRFIRSHFLKISLNNGYRVAYLSPPGQRTKQRKLYIDKAIAKLWPNQAIDVAGDAVKRRANSRRHKNIDLVNFPGEEWRDIVGYEGLYRISNLGRVMSLARMILHKDGIERYTRACILSSGRDASGYPKAELAKGGRVRTILIHRLVALAFIPNPLGLECVHHKDEDKTNPRADNLEWTTRGDNVRDWFDRRDIRHDTDAVKNVAKALGISIAAAWDLMFKKS